MSPYLTRAELAALIRVSITTTYRLEKQGALVGVPNSPSGKIRVFRRTDVERYMRERERKESAA